MKWDAERSAELRRKIAGNEELTRALSESVDGILRKHGVELGGVSYVFEPRVFRMDPEEAPELIARSQRAMEEAVAKSVPGATADALERVPMRCMPRCGYIDPLTLRTLDKFRTLDPVAEDPVPIEDAYGLMRRIAGNRELLGELGETVFGQLEKHAITLSKGEGCVFTPCVFETPTHARKGAVSENADEVTGFGPRVLGDPKPRPNTPIGGPTVGVISPP
jgi:hypothetical protein